MEIPTRPDRPHATRRHAGPATSAAAEADRDDRGAAVSVRDLVCRYGSFVAVRGIDLTVHHGELFALLGTNGAGKTTTLETLEGHRRADGGRVRVLGTDPHRSRGRLAARIGVVFQQSGLPGTLTPREVLAVWTRLTPDANRHHDAMATLARVDLSHRAGTRIQQLSGGERRRLELALALVNDPELVFLDEPTTGMDPQARAGAWDIIRGLVADGTTVVLTTHYLEEAEALADRLAIMHQGQVAASGTLGEVIASAPARISARLPQHAPRPPVLDAAQHLDPTGRLTVSTRHLQDTLTRLLRWADEHDVALTDLHAAERSLAQAFHRIAGTGHRTDDRTDVEASR